MSKMYSRPHAIFIFLNVVKIVASSYSEPVCDVIYKQKSEWNCDDYKYFYTFHHGANLENTLKCLHYEKYLSPDEQEKPLDINGTIELKKLDYLNIEIFELKMDVKLEISWIDPRLKWPEKCKEEVHKYEYSIDEKYWEHLWNPQIIIEDINSIDTADTLGPAQYLKLSQIGFVRRGGRFKIQKLCEMDFADFPFDEHECTFAFRLVESHEELVLQWPQDISQSSTLEDIRLPSYKVSISHGYKYNTTYKNKTSSGIKFDMVFQRMYSIEILQFYVPSVMLCIASACANFVPPELVPGRMGLCVTSFLSTISLFNGAKGNWPKTSYMKASDLWTLFCYIGVFYSMIEYCLILYLRKPNTKIATQQTKKFAFEGPLKNQDTKKMVWAQKIDLASQIIVPLYFTIFISFYFLICLA